MKQIIKIIVLAVVVLIVLSTVKNTIAQTLISGAISSAVHAPVQIGSTHVGLIAAKIDIKNLRVYNPSGFPDKQMIDVPRIFIDFDPSALFKGQAHFKEVKLDLKEMVVVRNKDGKLNVDSVKPTADQKKESKEQAKPSPGKKASKLMIDKLSISIGQVVYKDYSAGGVPQVQTFNINIKDREYTHIDNPASVVSLLMFEVLTRTTLSSLTSLDVNAFKDGGLQALSKGLGVVGDGTEVVQNKAKELLNFLS